ncbi:MAG: DNA-binding protein [Pseudonocardiales bacterium]|nr:MAG: DNA-binding protein [Pseudonocardiales bacterium]
MNKAELIKAVEERLEGDRKTAQQAVNHVVDTIIRAVAKGEKVAITGFGVFEKRRRGARTARNPKTGAAVKVKATSVPAFRAGAGFKEVVSGAKKLEKLAKSTVAKKATTPKSTAAKKTAAAKTLAKKSPAKSPAKKTAAAKTLAKKAPAKKAPAAKTTVKRAAAAKAPAAKSTTAKKAPAAKKTAAQRPPARKAAKRSG